MKIQRHWQLMLPWLLEGGGMKGLELVAACGTGPWVGLVVVEVVDWGEVAVTGIYNWNLFFYGQVSHMSNKLFKKNLFYSFWRL